MSKKNDSLLAQMWETHHRLLKEITALGEINIPLAYGLIRTAETILDMMLVQKLQRAEKFEQEAKTEAKKGENIG